MRKESGGSVTLYWMLGDHLGSVSLILTGSGNQINPLEKVTYTPWGSILSGSITLTMKGFTGQYRDSYINLVWMNSRWYDPELGRWTQPDVIVPANQGVQGFDRYGYVSNSPVNWIDPSGHGRESTDCGPDGIFCDTMGKLLSNSEIYDILLTENWIEPLPDASIIFIADYNSMSRVNGVLANYEKTRKYLFAKHGWDAFGRFFDQTGKLFDNVFMAMVAMGEFASKTGEAFLESIEALSNQYYGDIMDNPGPMQCSGNCSFTQQLLWATQFEAWYNSEFFDKYVKTGAWMGQLDTAQKAVNRYSNGEDTSWFWGNVTKDGQTKYALTITPVLSDYPEKPWFIVYSYEIK